MEYCIFTTYKCNLRCSYCLASSVLTNDSSLEMDDKKIDKLVEYIQNDISRRDQKDNFITFHGGEPTLVPKTIADIIDKTSKLNIKYALYTNGLMLDKIPDELLNKIDVILVSIDGDKESHEKHRGIGSYDKTLENVRKIKTYYKKHLIGRITLEEETDINTSVRNLLDTFDSVFWQIVNKPNFNMPDSFINNYSIQVKQLFEYWYSNFIQGKIVNIIPFQAILKTIFFERENTSFRCGSGVSFQAIDLNGNVYECDEFIGDCNRIIGNINTSFNINLTYKSHTTIFEDCKKCEISSICLGRCRRMFSVYSQEHIKEYCRLTKALHNAISEKIPDIEKFIKSNNISSYQLYNCPYSIEEIP